MPKFGNYFVLDLYVQLMYDANAAAGGLAQARV